jgi:hypothetical protein
MGDKGRRKEGGIEFRDLRRAQHLSCTNQEGGKTANGGRGRSRKDWKEWQGKGREGRDGESLGALVV